MAVNNKSLGEAAPADKQIVPRPIDCNHCGEEIGETDETHLHTAWGLVCADCCPCED